MDHKLEWKKLSNRREDKGGQHCSDDLIGRLPDEILISILLQLPLKEAAATSLISRRWMNLWTYLTCLRFDDHAPFFGPKGPKKFDDDKRSSYVTWVDHILSSNKSPCLEELKFWFDLDKKFKTSIDPWVRFAFERNVQRFDLDLSLYGDGEDCIKKRYTLSHEFLLGIGRPPRGLIQLKELSLKSVNVNDAVVRLFLSACPLLERLSILGSRVLLNVKVSGESLLLKYLEIRHCDKLKSIDICDVNLISFVYHGDFPCPDTKKLSLKNVPKLIHLSIAGELCYSFAIALPHFESLLPQLETLTTTSYTVQTSMEFDLVKLTNLKTLVFGCYSSFTPRSLLGYISYLKAAPFIRKFVFQVHRLGPFQHEKKPCYADELPCTYQDEVDAVECQHQYLEELEFCGYNGLAWELQLLACLLKIAVALKRIIIDPNRYDEYPQRVKRDEMEVKAARARAKKQLHPMVPRGIELIIL